MIIIKEMKWGNWFSYGDSNSIQLNDAKVTQITGKNGSGKSSIPVIIGEILYGKNALGKTKAKLSNRYLDNANTWGTISFTKEDTQYKIDYNRRSTLKLSLTVDGTDISSHTTSDTYKTIGEILGYDFKTFWGLIYQSSKEGLEFLTATDTNRKKFLIKFFNLDIYLHIHELFKTISTQKNTEIQVIKGKISTIEEWIKKNEKIDLTPKVLDSVPNINKQDIDEIANLKVKLENLRADNKKINDNNTYKRLLKDLDTSILSVSIEVPENEVELRNKATELNKEIAVGRGLIDVQKQHINKINKLEDKCPTCEQNIDQEFKESLIAESTKVMNDISEANKQHNILADDIENELKRISTLKGRKLQQQKVQKELSDLLKQIDESLPDEVQKEADIQDAIDTLSNNISKIQLQINQITAANLDKEAHNSKVKVVKEQLKEYNEQFDELQEVIGEHENTSTKLNIIKKAFSTNGLLSYKLEHLSKDLEDQINVYLAELSKGRFQLSFTIAGEKLNVEIIDDGRSIGIEELSAGELARVNTSTLLAIRKLMAAISSNKINILFLDEITGVLDDEGKEVLIDILNSETELNTFLVSHEFTHPLIPQINVVKESKISRIED